MENNEGDISNKDENNNVNNNQNENLNTSNKQQDKKSKIFLRTLIPIIVLICISTAIIIPIKIQEIRYNKTVKNLMLGKYLPTLPNNQIEIKENNKTRLIMNLKKVKSKAYNQIIENAKKKYPLDNSNKMDEFIGYNQNGFKINIHRTLDTVDIEIKRTIVQKQSSIDIIENAEKN